MFTTEQRQAIRWLSLPKRLRDPQTQRGLATKIGVHFTTLSRWKKLAEFKDAVEAARRDLIEDKLSDMYDMAVTRALAGDDKFYKMVMDTVKDTWGKRELTVKTGIQAGQERNLSPEEIAEHLWKKMEKHTDGSKDDLMALLGGNGAAPPTARA